MDFDEFKSYVREKEVRLKEVFQEINVREGGSLDDLQLRFVSSVNFHFGYFLLFVFFSLPQTNFIFGFQFFF